MRRRFEHQRPPMFERQLLEKPQKRFLPLIDLGARYIPKRQVSIVMVTLLQKHPPHAWRFEREIAQCRFILLWRSHVPLDVVHRPAFGHEKLEELRAGRFRDEKSMRKERLIIVGEREALVDRHQVMQMRRAASPMAENEDRRMNVGLRDLLSISPIFVPTRDTIANALG